MKDLLRALGLLTILPIRTGWEGAVPGRAMAAYPLAGAVIGAALAAVAWLLSRTGLAARAPLLPAGLLLAAWVTITGALHLDGWADCCDALFVPVGRQRRLEILKDPRLGSFGGAGLVTLLIVKLAAIQGALGLATGAGWLSAHVEPWSLRLLPAPALALFVAPVLARWAVVIIARGFPPARPEGMAVYFRRGLGTREIIIATAIAALASLAAGPLHAAALWLAAAITAFGLASLANTRLGGLTGDVYGATIELVETAVLVVASLL
jgi:adenosylcobinamide-GDP ribazoletransferase